MVKVFAWVASLLYLLSERRQNRADDFFVVSVDGVSHLFTNKKNALDYASTLNAGVKIKRISV
ncbi:hypothetical protein FACS1894116_01410 [Betaproteobacteria bacterium]|nr:hypothetical protein FACS1894116_01410 [Betaproteobacteria bacterium]GHU24926.1 hypothetical protein FACS189488_10670 [Betaproteobacteria bacterium]GHU28454.1 hypothetical protein FACS189497_03950 [Betaproteobacteria bacterium]